MNPQKQRARLRAGILALALYSALFLVDAQAQKRYDIVEINRNIILFRAPNGALITKGQSLLGVRQVDGRMIRLARVRVAHVGKEYGTAEIEKRLDGKTWQRGDYLIDESDLIESDGISEVEYDLQSLASYKSHDGGFAISAGISTLGYGAQLYKSIIRKINLRVGVNNLTYTRRGVRRDKELEYDAEFKLNSFSALLDWHPAAGGFRFSFGALVNNNKANVLVKTTESYTVGGTTYSPDEIGDLNGVIDFERLAPYLGIGWGNAVGEDKRFGLTLDLGTIYQNSPRVDLTATGLITATAEQEPKVEDDLREFRFYPVIAFGLTYKIF